jgi:hypothetical protein
MQTWLARVPFMPGRFEQNMNWPPPQANATGGPLRICVSPAHEDAVEAS